MPLRASQKMGVRHEWFGVGPKRFMKSTPEGEFLVKKVMSWEGVRREFGLRYL